MPVSVLGGNVMTSRHSSDVFAISCDLAEKSRSFLVSMLDLFIEFRFVSDSSNCSFSADSPTTSLVRCKPPIWKRLNF